jgi:hypothetical protein
MSQFFRVRRGVPPRVHWTTRSRYSSASRFARFMMLSIGRVRSRSPARTPEGPCGGRDNKYVDLASTYVAAGDLPAQG